METFTDVRHHQEHDEANAVAWMNSTTEAHKIHLWMAIQNLGGTAECELISRFAQLGFTHAILLAQKGAGE